MASNDDGCAHDCQLVSGRQVGCGRLISTTFPRTVPSQRVKPALSAAVAPLGSRTTSAVTPPAGVGGLHASCVASSVRARGDTSSMRLSPRLQSRQVPYFSLRAGMPHDV